MAAEQELKESLKGLHDLKAALNEQTIVAAVGPQGKIARANEKLCAISMNPGAELACPDHGLVNPFSQSRHPKEDL